MRLLLEHTQNNSTPEVYGIAVSTTYIQLN